MTDRSPESGNVATAEHPVLATLAMQGMKLGLDDVTRFLAFCGDPHHAYPVIHVAGTNGKGSVCAMLTEVLVAAGYRVGTNTSPHLERVNERVRIDGVPIDDPTLFEAIEALERDRWAWATSAGLTYAPLTYFEFVTCLALRVFAEQQVDVAVIEVGLGGRLDATNVVSPVVTAITSIGLDHVVQLGPDLASIAGEKAGILKPGVPGVVGPVAPEARAAIEAKAARVGAPLWLTGTHVRREKRGPGWVIDTPEGSVGPVTLALLGAHQGANASVAVGVLHQLRRVGFAVADDAIVAGLSRARVAGRIEEVRPGVFLDGAHNPDGTVALAAWLSTRPRPARRILLFGMGVDREPRALLTPLLPHFDEVVLTQCAHPAARAPMDIWAALGAVDGVVSDGGPIAECLHEVLDEADEVVIAGSLYLVGEARKLLST